LINIGAYRMMTLGGPEASVAITMGKHGRQHYEKWWKRRLLSDPVSSGMIRF
jgi:3-polyprenyl-4-hydroxybenzoate decarboxylase